MGALVDFAWSPYQAFVEAGASLVANTAAFYHAFQLHSTEPPQQTTPNDQDGLFLLLQGGGKLGALQAGVLIKLLEAGYHISGISGTSAGAVNGALIAAGLAVGGPAKAIEYLKHFWNLVGINSSAFAAMPPIWQSCVQAMHELNTLSVPAISFMLHHVIGDEALLNRADICALYVNATDKKTHENVIFEQPHLTFDKIAASAAFSAGGIPAVKVDGQFYIDGGEGGGANPPVKPVMDYLSEGGPARRVLAVLMSNHNDTKPQAGELVLDSADGHQIKWSDFHDQKQENLAPQLAGLSSMDGIDLQIINAGGRENLARDGNIMHTSAQEISGLMERGAALATKWISEDKKMALRGETYATPFAQNLAL